MIVVYSFPGWSSEYKPGLKGVLHYFFISTIFHKLENVSFELFNIYGENGRRLIYL